MLADGRSQRGVSLIEALVALAVMAFGMLGIVGVQSMLRLNSDVAKQRSEAVRLAQQMLEDSRSFIQVALPSTDNVGNYGNVVNQTQHVGYDTATSALSAYVTNSGATLSAYDTNTLYALTRTLLTPSGEGGNSADPRMKTVQIHVSWTDRTGATQDVWLNTVISRVMPELAGTLAVAGAVNAAGVPTRGPNGRIPTIPLQAVNLGNGTSGFMPPQAAGGTAVWVFDNTTALITLCTLAAGSTSVSTLADINASSCTGRLQLLSGYIAFGASNLVSEALNPTGTAQTATLTLTQTSPTGGTVNCAVAAVHAGVASTAYYCAVPVSTPTLAWSGTTAVGGLAGTPTVCRYTTTAAPVPNSQHPLNYSLVNTALAQQNFLVLPSGSCPGVLSGSVTTVSP